MSRDPSCTATTTALLRPGRPLAKAVGAVVGLAALVWFLVRVLPKPSRAAYPCQRAAFPVASVFVLWIAGSLAGFALADRLRQRIARVRLGMIVVGLVIAIGFAPWRALLAGTTEPGNQPTGVARGINPGRVVWSRDPAATLWSGANDGTHWWDPARTDQARVDAVLSSAMRTLTSTTSDAAAWDALFRSFNVRRGNGNIGYAQSARKGIAVKINQNPTNQGNNYYYANNGVSGDANAITGNPHLLLALVNSLVAAGVQETDITITDPTSLNHQWGGPRTIGDSIYTYVHAVHPGVHFVDGVGQQGRELAAWPTTDQIVYTTGKGGTETLGLKIAQQLLDAGFIINMAIMKSHGDGPTVCFKNQYGSVSGQRHGPIYGNTANYYSNTIEPMGHQELGEKTVLFMVDALYGASSPNVAPTKWTKAPFNGAWPSSVFLSEDVVAIDSVAFDFMNAEWGLTQNTDYYLHDAASVPNAQGQKLSGTVYRPTAGSSAILGSLGVHEHWNNATARQYSRNLDPVNGTGIELVALTPGGGTGGAGTGGAGTGGATTGGRITGGASSGGAAAGGVSTAGSGTGGGSSATGGSAATGGIASTGGITNGGAVTATGGSGVGGSVVGGSATAGGGAGTGGSGEGTETCNCKVPSGSASGQRVPGRYALLGLALVGLVRRRRKG
jgi:MYXO-CTERM domain-containing protein